MRTSTAFSFWALVGLFFLVGLPDAGAQPCQDPDGLAGEDQTVCWGETVSLGCPVTYDWCYKWYPEEYFPHISYTYEPNPTTLPLAHDVEFSLYLSDDSGDVFGPYTTTVTVEDIGANAGQNFEVCPGGSATLTASVSLGTNHSYEWSTGEMTQTIVVTPEESAFYSVTVTDLDTECQSEDDCKVVVLPTPNILLLPEYATLCSTELPGFTDPSTQKLQMGDCSVDQVFLYAGTGNPSYTYNWSTGETSSTIAVTEPGTYEVTLTNSYGCTSEGEILIESCVELEVTPGIEQVGGNDVPVLDAGQGYSTYEWHDGTMGQTVNIIGPGLYSVTVTNFEGCVATKEININSFNYSLEELFNVLISYDADNFTFNYFICNSGSYSEAEKQKINELIKPYAAQSVPFASTAANNYIWTCDAIHSIDAQIDKMLYTATQDSEGNVLPGVRVVPILIKQDISSSEFIPEVYYLNSAGTAYVYHQWKLNIGNDEYTLDLSNGVYDFSSINFSQLDYLLTSSVSIKEEGGNVYSELVTQNVEFKGPVVTENYELFIDDNLASDEVEIGSKELIELDLRVETPSGFVSVDPVNTGITWKVDNVIQFPLLDSNPITYEVPAYNPFDLGLSYIVSVYVGGQKVDEIEITSLSPNIDPGIHAVIPPNNQLHSETQCVGPGEPNPADFLTEALSQIQSTDPEMFDFFNEPSNNRQLDIILSTSNSISAIYGNQGQGILYGLNVVDVFTDEDMFIRNDPNLISLSTEPNYGDCPYSAKFLLKITDDEYDALYLAIDNGLPSDAPPVISKISLVNPSIASNLTALCDLTGGATTSGISQLNLLRDNNELYYEATMPEVESRVIIPMKSSVYLAVDNLMNPGLYAEIGFDQFTYSISTSNWPVLWYLDNTLFNQTPSEHCGIVNDVRQEKFTRTLAHEMGHSLFKYGNVVEAGKWHLLKDNPDINFSTCYPGQNGHNYPGNCSNAPGHEIHNPEGVLSCEKGEEYDEPGHYYN